MTLFEGAAKGAASGEAGAAAKFAGASEAAGAVSGAAKNLSWMIVVLGVIHFILRLTTGGTSAITFVFSLTLFILAGYALAQKTEKNRTAILIPMLIFVIWYFLFGGNYDPEFLLYFGAGIVIISLIFGIFSKGQSVKPELLGFIPVIFFFLDIGLIAFLVENLGLPITPLMESLVLFMPWWAFFGLLTLPAEPSESKFANTAINITRILGILYLVFVFMAPSIPNLGYDQSMLPSAAEFEEAQARLREQLPQKENPAWSNLKCLIEGQYTDIEGCVEEKQAYSELSYSCTEIEKKKEGTPEFEECIAEKKKEKEEVSLMVGGVIDPTIKVPTSAELVVNKDYFPKFYAVNLPFPVELKIKNPRKLVIKVEMFCNFTDKISKESFLGRIEPSTSPAIEFKEEELGNTFFCYPPEGKVLNASYSLEFSAKLLDLNTQSLLQRAFIGDKTPEEKKALLPEINKIVTIKESKAPKEFAMINFDLGHVQKDSIIENKPFKTLSLTSNIKNAGMGKILVVKRFQIELPGFAVDNSQCLYETNIDVSGYKKIISRPPCQVKDYPAELKSTKDWVPKTFIANLDYDYLISKSVDVTFKEVTS